MPRARSNNRSSKTTGGKSLHKKNMVKEKKPRNREDIFLVLDSQGNFIDANNAYVKLIGYKKSELLKMNLRDVRKDVKVKEILLMIYRVIKDGSERLTTKHQTKNGNIIKLQADVFCYKDNGYKFSVFAKNITNIDLSGTDEAERYIPARNLIEQQLADSYKHLGQVNRKIALLVELIKDPHTKKDRNRLIEHVLKLAMNLSEANAGYIYSSAGYGKFKLLASTDKMTQKNAEENPFISTRKIKILNDLVKKKVQISGKIKKEDSKLLALDTQLEHFIALPLREGSALGGFILIGFCKMKSVATQDLEFLDIFSVHASTALTKVGALKKD